MTTSLRGDRRKVDHPHFLVGSGLIAVVAFFMLAPPVASTTRWIAGVEVLLLLVLAIEIARYDDIRRR